MLDLENFLSDEDPFGLSRFVKAQDKRYSDVLAELEDGHKRSHWIWYIFPQVDGLARSSIAKFYSIGGVKEGEAYLAHPILQSRLLECCNMLLSLEGYPISRIMGFPDDLKLKSSMTLFAKLAPNELVFESVLSKYFSGEQDQKTLEILEGL